MRNDYKAWLRANAPQAKVTGEFDISLNAVAVQLSGVKPARRADCASDRAEIAAMSSEGFSACEFLGKSVGVPEVEIDRLF